MRNEDLFLAWAPDESPWSAWAKPVLFASMPNGGPALMPSWISVPHSDHSPTGEPAFSSDTALVIDLPGEKAVRAGLAAAGKGWRPVPLFNGCHGAQLTKMIVDTRPLVQSLAEGAALVANSAIPAGAPPAFLLDQRRLSGADRVGPGDYDNRWCVVPQDMPSARALKQAGIRRVVLVADTVMEDLAHILRRYEEGGLALAQVRSGQSKEAPLSVPRPRFFRSVWHRLLVLAGLRRNAAGGFGAFIPVPSQSSGYG